MEWKTIAPLVGAVAPLAGSILGGLIPFPGASMIGQKFGEIIAKQLGVAPTPQAVSDKLAELGEETARTKITAALEQARAEIQGFVDLERATLEAMVKNAADVNATMRAELTAPESLFYRGWRPAFGWTFVIVWGAFGLMLTYVTGRAVLASNDAMKTLVDAWPLFAAYFGPGAAVLGVLIPSRSIEKKAAIENAAPMPNAKPAPPVVLPKPKPPAFKSPLARTD